MHLSYPNKSDHYYISSLQSNFDSFKYNLPKPIMPKGGFPLGEIFRLNRNFLLSYKHSGGTKQKSFEFEQ
jgi:hypothetical protein